ncbi:type II secretion system F family protein [Oceanobacillus sp. Castelsardo]|uniref:type II secretion system F family protein n=1 Tax=Oceanobacillus sp. Castelsardo TaxID=1851204 RepID=UPI0008382D95|nr:type II secretion system F family protein [Oceanobacillus sp. Castelsardo]
MNFQYSGKRISGQKIKGKIDADSKAQALRELESSGLIILNIEETKPWNKDIILNKKVKVKDFVVFLRQYATLIRAGISISDSTKTMIEQTENYALKTALTDIDKQLGRGVALSKAAERHPKVFPSLLVNMIHAGEASGKLDDILNEMADYYEKDYRNKQKVVSALMYPSVVGVITILLSIFLLVFIVPTFVNMFGSMGEEVPAYTQFVLNLSDWVGKYWWILFAVVILAAVLYKYFIQFDRFAYQVDVIKMRFPLLGVLAHKGALVRMTQTLSTLVNSSVPILQSMEITERVVGNRVIRDVIGQAREQLTSGESIARAMKGHWAFPPLIVQMIQIGERTGTLDHMLRKAAEFYEEEVNQLSDRIKTLIEPIMVVILSLLVGGIVLAMVIPMFSMFETF